MSENTDEIQAQNVSPEEKIESSDNVCSDKVQDVSCSTDSAENLDTTAEEEEGSKTLEEALEKFGIELPPKKVLLLKEYCELLWTWNERLNLTRHTSFDKFVARDLVDSMHLAALLQKGEHVLDVGSGGGVPGLVVAILRPDVVVELSDSTGKKAEALGAMVDALGLDLNVWYAKAEDLLRTRHFHTLTIRAVGKMRSLLTMFAPVWHTFERILMIKGPTWLAERGEARHYNMFNSLALRKVDEYTNPGAENNSVILQVCRKNRLEDVERRAKERLEGKPYDGEIEEIVVDNKPRNPENVGEKRNYRGKRSNGPRGERSRQETRSFVKVQDRRNNQAEQSEDVPQSGKEVRVFSRRNSKPPKGWTGKKSEFREKSDSVQDKPWRKDSKRTEDRTKSSPTRSGKNYRKSGKGYGRRSDNNPGE